MANDGCFGRRFSTMITLATYYLYSKIENKYILIKRKGMTPQTDSIDCDSFSWCESLPYATISWG